MASNGTATAPQDEVVYNSYTTADFFIGLAITLGASTLQAFGLNITKLDHQRNQRIPRAQRKADYLRPLWWLGLLAYIISQLVGSTLALQFLRAEYVAPLGSASLIFNFIFARYLCGTPIQRLDLIGTFVIIIGVVGIIVLGNQRSADAVDAEANLDLDMLKSLWGRTLWIVYLTILEVVTSVIFWISSIMDDVLREREEVEVMQDDSAPELEYGRHSTRDAHPENDTFWGKVQNHQKNARKFLKSGLANWAGRKPDPVVKKFSGFLWASSAGMLSGQTLIFAKTVVKLISTGSQFASPIPIIVILLLAATALLQIYALNKGLKAADSTLVVPVLFAFYTAFGFLNSLIYLDQLHTYSRTITAFICLSILVLIIGVGILSSKKTEVAPKATTEDLEEAENAGESDLPETKGFHFQPVPLVDRAKGKLSALKSKMSDGTDRQKRPGTTLLSDGTDREDETVWELPRGKGNKDDYELGSDEEDEFGGFVDAKESKGDPMR